MRLLVGPAVLALVVVPALADLMVNGDFEAGIPPWNGDIELNSEVWNPGPSPNGGNYASAQAGGSPAMSFQQVVSGLPPDPVTLTGYIAGGVLGTSAHIGVELIGATTAANDWSLNDWGLAWTAFPALTVQPSGGQVIVRFYATATTEWSSGTAVHADGVELTPEPVTLTLFGLAALPFLRSRRR